MGWDSSNLIHAHGDIVTTMKPLSDDSTIIKQPQIQERHFHKPANQYVGGEEERGKVASGTRVEEGHEKRRGLHRLHNSKRQTRRNQERVTRKVQRTIFEGKRPKTCEDSLTTNPQTCQSSVQNEPSEGERSEHSCKNRIKAGYEWDYKKAEPAIFNPNNMEVLLLCF